MPESTIESAIAAAEQDGLRLHLRIRLAILAMLAVWAVLTYAPSRALLGLAVLATFAVFGIAQYALGRWLGHAILWAGVITVFEVALLIGVVLTPITFPADWPPQMQLRLPSVIYLFVYVAGTVLSYSPSLVVWTGALTTLGWGIGHQIMLRLPGTIAVQGSLIDNPWHPQNGSLAFYLDPYYVSNATWRAQTVLLVLLTTVLAAAVARSRRLLQGQVTDHVARATLSRYFSPNVVDMLAMSGPTGTAARRQPVAVLFADIRGFTTLSESLGTEGTMRLLQEFHDVVTAVVFAHRGTLEKYIGDAVMATFGTPAPEFDDASRALRCANELALEASRWSEARTSRGDTPVEIGMGLHYGEAMVGSIGAGQRLDYVVIGDTVNVASRLERLTRDLDVEIVASNDLVARVREEGPAAGAALDLLTPRGDVHVTGRRRPIRIWSAEQEHRQH